MKKKAAAKKNIYEMKKKMCTMGKDECDEMMKTMAKKAREKQKKRNRTYKVK